MRVGIVYTSTTPELVEFVEKELHEAIGPDAEFISFKDPSIIAEVRELVQQPIN